MKQIYVLLKNEYQKRRSSYWMPVWIIAGISALIALLVLGAVIGNWDNIQLGFGYLPFDFESVGIGVRIAVYGIMMSMSIVFILFMLMNTQSSLSKEKELGCELFYRCQPVSRWSVTGVKYLMHTYASGLLLLGLGLIVALIAAIVTACTVGGFFLGNAVYGALLGFLTFLKFCLVFGSLYFFFSAVFKNNAFVKGTILLGIIELVFFLIETLFRKAIILPNIFTNLFALVGDLNVNEELSLGMVIGDPRLIIAVFLAAAFYIGGSLIYQYKPCEA
jgi:hypothetical protein